MRFSLLTCRSNIHCRESGGVTFLCNARLIFNRPIKSIVVLGMLSRASVTTLFLLLSDAVVAQHSVRQAPTWVGFDALKYWFAFGDSYSWTSFDVDGLQPNASNPLGNPAYASITTSNGPNYVDYLTTSYNASFIQTYKYVYYFPCT